MPFVVHNLTKRTIILADLRAEIGPQKMLDLEKVAERSAIDGSIDLRLALDTGRLRLCSNAILSAKRPQVQVVERIIEHHHHNPAIGLDETRLLEMIRSVVQEQPKQDSNAQLLDAMQKLQQQLAQGKSVEQETSTLDPQILADLQAKAIEKISDGIEASNKKTSKKVVLKDTKLGDLAKELE